MTVYLASDTLSCPVHPGGLYLNQVFGINHTEAPFMAYMQADGILGLPFQFIASDSATSEQGGVVFGGIDSSHYTGQIMWMPLSFNTYRKVKWTGAKKCIQNQQTVGCSVGCVIDTGTSLTVGPTSDINNINTWVGGSADLRGDLSHPIAAVNCQNFQNMTNVTFTLNGNTFTDSASSYISQETKIIYQTVLQRKSGEQPCPDNESRRLHDPCFCTYRSFVFQ
ncbi:LOW QUALITY PROTEIN: pepsin-3-like [Odontesthes bonariensis]